MHLELKDPGALITPIEPNRKISIIGNLMGLVAMLDRWGVSFTGFVHRTM